MEKNVSKNLISLLKYLKFDVSNFSYSNLNNDIFKSPNKELFRKIICFLLSEIGDFDQFVGAYSVSTLPAVMESRFRGSLKDVSVKINYMYPFANLKAINQSQLISPHGPKVIAFLIALCKIVVKVKTIHTTPNEDELLNNPSLGGAAENFDVNLDYNINEAVLEQTKLDASVDRYKLLTIEVIEQSDLPSDLKTKLMNYEDIDSTLINWKMTLLKKIEEQHDAINNLLSIKSFCCGLMDLVRTIKATNTVILDGHSVLNDLGFKNNIMAKIKEIDLIENGELKLTSVFDVVQENMNELARVIDTRALENSVLSIGELLDKINKDCLTFHELLQELNFKIGQHNDIVNELMSGTNEDVDPSQIPYPEVNDNFLFFNNPNSCTVEKREFPLPEPFFEPPPNLINAILAGKGNHPICSSSNSVKKSASKSLRRSPLLGRKCWSKKSEMLNRAEWRNDGCQRPVFDVKPLLGLCGENRRATLGSPLACKERFKIKHIDDRRKPLKPTSTKALMFSSSPLSDCNTKMHSFGDESKVEITDEYMMQSISVINTEIDSGDKLKLPATDECSIASELKINIDSATVPCSSTKPDLDDSLSKYAAGCGFPTTNLLQNNSPLNLTSDILKWEDSILTDSLTKSPSVMELSPCNSPRLNESTEFIIAQYKSLKQQLTKDGNL